MPGNRPGQQIGTHVCGCWKRWDANKTKRNGPQDLVGCTRRVRSAVTRDCARGSFARPGFLVRSSTYSSAAAGARAAYILLPRLGISVQRWQEPPFRLLPAAGQATLILAEPSELPSRRERNALRNFVSAGGRVLFCGSNLPVFFGGVQLHPIRSAPAPITGRFAAGVEKYSPTAVADGETGREHTVELRPAAYWTRWAQSQKPVYGDRNSAVVAVWKIGNGEVVWWAAATPLTNVGLNWASNLSLFINSIGPGRRVYWDEYFHGERGSLWSYLDRTAVRWAVLHLTLLAVAALFTFSRRSGPVIPARQMSRLSPLEFVQTLGALYRRGKAEPIVIEVTARELRLKLAQRLRLAASATDGELVTAAAERLQWNSAEVLGTLQAAQAAAAAPRVRKRDALAIVQKIQRLTARLRIVQERS